MPTDNLTNPHDKFFRETFSRQEVARDFVKYHLPPEVVILLDPDSLEISKDSFIDPALEEHFSDLLYQVKLNDGQPLYIYLLFDHKSYVDPLVAFQLLRYMMRIWELSLKQQSEQRKPQPRRKKTPLRLPPIFPLVVYHGLDKWTVSTEFSGLFDLPPALHPYVPNYRYWLADLSAIKDDELKGYVILKVGLLLLKYIQRAELGEQLSAILGLLRALTQKQTALEYLETILRYVMSGSDTMTRELLEEKVQQLFEEGEAATMPTIAETLREEGRIQGESIGLIKGRQEAQADAERKMKQLALRNIRQTLAIRFSTHLEQYDKQLQSLDLPMLERLNELAFTVATLAEFEAELPLLIAKEPLDKMMTQIKIINIEPKYAAALEQLQIDCYPTLDDAERMKAAHFLSHCRVFPEGNFIALDGERVVGLGSGFFINFDFEHTDHTFIEVIAHGYFTNHDLNGDYYYGADISVHPDYRGHGIGGMLYEARKGVVKQYNKKGIVAGGALPGYVRYKGKLTIPEYVAKVVAGELFDSTLSFQLKNGFVVKGLLENYMNDSSHDNWGTLIVWANPLYRAE